MKPLLIRRVPVIAGLFAILTLAACSQHAYVSVADDHLQPTAKGNFDFVFVGEGERIPRFETVFIEPTEVSLSDYWLREHRGDYTDRDLTRIHENYGRLLNEALSEGLIEHTGLVVTNNRAEADMVLRPKLKDLNIYGPDLSTPDLRRYYVQEAGNATFDLVLLSPDDRVIAQFVDHREAYPMAGDRLEWTNRVTNYRRFSHLMDRWTRNLSTYLLIGGAVPTPEEES